MKINLKSLSTEELDALQSDISAEIVSRQKEARQELLREFRAKAKAAGTTLEDLMTNQKGGKTKGRASKAVPKYANPADKSQTWTGHGKRPRWANDWLAAGKDLDALKI